jgi:hypothetical protein
MVENLYRRDSSSRRAASHFAVPVMEGEEEFLVVMSRVFARLDHQKAVLAGVLGFLQVVPAKVWV